MAKVSGCAIRLSGLGLVLEASNGGSGGWGAGLEEDEPSVLEKKRKRTSMQGDNMLGEKRPKLVLLRV